MTIKNVDALTRNTNNNFFLSVDYLVENRKYPRKDVQNKNKFVKDEFPTKIFEKKMSPWPLLNGGAPECKKYFFNKSKIII